MLCTYCNYLPRGKGSISLCVLHLLLLLYLSAAGKKKDIRLTRTAPGTLTVTAAKVNLGNVAAGKITLAGVGDLKAKLAALQAGGGSGGGDLTKLLSVFKPAACTVANSNKQPGFKCACKPGYTGKVIWKAGVSSGSCVKAVCKLPNTNKQSGPACKCLDGFSGKVSWKADKPSANCKVAACTASNSNMKPGKACKCNPGYVLLDLRSCAYESFTSICGDVDVHACVRSRIRVAMLTQNVYNFELGLLANSSGAEARFQEAAMHPIAKRPVLGKNIVGSRS